tara:strand:+ start:231 stop:926 length:696 start_codon:yes stop_codon:yes gene_type:complete
MPVIKNILRRGQIKYQGLKDFDVFVQEEQTLAEGAATSDYFKITNFPTPLPSGNSFFSIEGSDLLKDNIEIKTEILDANGKPIFHYPVFNRSTPRSVDVTIEIIGGSVVSGTGTFIILGELDPNKFDIPIAFQDTYNIRVVSPINIDIDIPNTRPIKFFKPPVINVSELVKENIVYSGGESTEDTTSILSITGSGTFFGGTNSGKQAGSPELRPYDEERPRQNDDFSTGER